eukprot:1144474-Pelagomonas_calceolata.AAC.1
MVGTGFTSILGAQSGSLPKSIDSPARHGPGPGLMREHKHVGTPWLLPRSAKESWPVPNDISMCHVTEAKRMRMGALGARRQLGLALDTGQVVETLIKIRSSYPYHLSTHVGTSSSAPGAENGNKHVNTARLPIHLDSASTSLHAPHAPCTCQKLPRRTQTLNPLPPTSGSYVCPGMNVRPGWSLGCACGLSIEGGPRGTTPPTAA